MDPAGGFDGTVKEILIVDGVIDKIADSIPIESDVEILLLSGEFVSPGFIDIHTHVYTRVSIGVPADHIGVMKGVTTIVDAGSAGPENMEDFVNRVISNSKTRVFSAMHYAKTGLLNMPEADEESKYDLDLAAEVYKQYADHIVAIKARASSSCTGQLGIKSIKAGKQLSAALGLPLYVHIGNMPPTVEDVLSVLEKGDIVTHAFHGKANNLFVDGKPKPETKDARMRGIYFDVGHGKESFSFETAMAAKASGFDPDVISSDLHAKNVDGPVYSLPVTMDKMMALGYPLSACIDMVTRAPARCMSLAGLGRLEAGCFADFTVFTLEKKETEFEDAAGGRLKGESSISVSYAIVGGVIEMNYHRQMMIKKLQDELSVPAGHRKKYEKDMERIFHLLDGCHIRFLEGNALAFASHVLSLFMRIQVGEKVPGMERAVLDQLDPSALEITGKVIGLIEQEYGAVDFSEMLLVAIHIHTAMEIMGEH